MLSVAPLRAFFKPGEPVGLRITSSTPLHSEVLITVYHLAVPIAQWTVFMDGVSVEIRRDIATEPRCGYLVRVSVGDQQAFTAFDVLNRWTEAPRYGFLYDFQPDRSQQDITETMDRLLALHVNGLQFYDWQYRHDTLLPPQADFTDPLGRPLSLETVRALIGAAHARGMAAMPYTAIYAASPSFAADHPDWQLFDLDGKPIDFAGGFLRITNPRGPWRAHFVQECRGVLDVLPFDGVHVDQYGEPQTGFDSKGTPVDLPRGFVETLVALRQVVGPDKAVIFNLVHNWPVGSIAGSPVDFWYSELWPPETDFRRLWRTIRDNRRLSDRPAILAVYIPPKWEQTVITAHSTILAAGGTHLAHGDHGRYLSDPYFPKAELPSPELSAHLQRLADFAVAYEEALAFADDVTDAWIDHLGLSGVAPDPGRVIIRTCGRRLFVNILNGSGQWDAELAKPEALEGVHISIAHCRYTWYSSPTLPIPQSLESTALPPIEDWLLVCLEFEDTPVCPT